MQKKEVENNEKKEYTITGKNGKYTIMERKIIVQKIKKGGNRQ